MSALPEPWLRGPIAGVHPITAPFLFAMTQSREDLTHWTENFTTDDLWARPYDLAPVGFHIRHIGGSAERLTTYLKGDQLSAEQLAALKREMEPGDARDALLAAMDVQLLWAEAIVKAIDSRTWTDLRTVGRKALPTTVGGLITHIAEHTQRHTGQAIITAKVVRATR